MNRVLAWTIGGGVSLALHGVMFSVISLNVEPEPVQTQPMPQSKLELQAYQVERASAAQSTPETTRADTVTSGGTALAQGEIPQSRSEGIAPLAQQLSARRAQSDDINSSAPKGSRLQVNEPELTSLVAGQVNETTVTNLKPKSNVVRQVQPVTAEVQNSPGLITSLNPQQSDVSILRPTKTPVSTVAQVAPTTVKLSSEDASVGQILQPATALVAEISQVTPVLVRLPSDTLLAESLQPASFEMPSNVALTNADQAVELASTLQAPASFQDSQLPVQEAPQTIAEPTELALLALPEQKAKADLAFSGAGDVDVDPVSLAAIQSFMQAGDLDTSDSAAGTVRDGISALLAQVPCSRLQVRFVPESGTLQLNGHVPENGLREPVMAALRAQVGGDIKLADNLLILPRPQCGALAGIEAVGLAQSTDQITNKRLVGKNTQVREFKFSEGARLILDMVAPDYDAYLYVDYFDADGQVIHLAPNETIALRNYTAETLLQIGAVDENIPSLEIYIGPPYGQEIGVAFAASEPLYEGFRPIVEPSEPYLEWLKDRVTEARAKYPGFKGEWVYFFITTRPK